MPLPLHFLEESQLDSPGAWHPDLARASHFLPSPHFASLLVCFFFFFFFSIGKNRKYWASSPGLPSKGCTHHIENISRKEKHTPPLESMALCAHPTPTRALPSWPQHTLKSLRGPWGCTTVWATATLKPTLIPLKTSFTTPGRWFSMWVTCQQT